VYRVIRIRLSREAEPLELQNPLKSSCRGEGCGVWCSLPIGCVQETRLDWIGACLLQSANARIESVACV
jgi:hypothetical protein